MADLKHQPVGNYLWGVWIRRSDLPQIVKAVCGILLTYANPDGSNVRVSEETLADEAIISDVRYLRDVLHLLRHLGLIEITKYGRKLNVPDTYQLTVPGAGYPAIPMRRDPQGKPIGPDGQPCERDEKGKLVRAKPLALRPFLAALQGEPLPARSMPIEREPKTPTGNGVPEQRDAADPATGNAVPPQNPGAPGTGNAVPEDPVDNSAAPGNPLPEGPVENPGDGPGYRQPVAESDGPPDEAFRQRVASLPATGCHSSGNPLPVTNLDQLPPTNSPKATTSPVETITPVENLDDIVITDAEYNAAREILSQLDDLGAALQAEVEADLARRGVTNAPTPLVITRAATYARSRMPTGHAP